MVSTQFKSHVGSQSSNCHQLLPLAWQWPWSTATRALALPFGVSRWLLGTLLLEDAGGKDLQGFSNRRVGAPHWMANSWL